MNEMLKVLYDTVISKLSDDGISIEARNILVEMKTKLTEMLKKEFTFDDLPEVKVKLEKFAKELEKLENLNLD